MGRFVLRPRQRVVLPRSAMRSSRTTSGPRAAQLDALVDGFEAHLTPVSRTLRFGLLAMLDLIRWLPVLLLVSLRPFEELLARAASAAPRADGALARGGAPRAARRLQVVSVVHLLRRPRRAPGHGLSGRRREETMAEARRAERVARARAATAGWISRPTSSSSARARAARSWRASSHARPQRHRRRRGRLGAVRRVRQAHAGPDDAAVLARGRAVRRRGARRDAVHQRAPGPVRRWLERAHGRRVLSHPRRGAASLVERPGPHDDDARGGRRALSRGRGGGARRDRARRHAFAQHGALRRRGAAKLGHPDEGDPPQHAGLPRRVALQLRLPARREDERRLLVPARRLRPRRAHRERRARRADRRDRRRGARRTRATPRRGRRTGRAVRGARKGRRRGVRLSAHAAACCARAAWGRGTSGGT